jgi:hypothetical protein
MGNDNGMVLTDDCVAGISASNGNRRCVANPEPFAGGRFVTYDVSSDDPWILDVLYTTLLQIKRRNSGPTATLVLQNSRPILCTITADSTTRLGNGFLSESLGNQINSPQRMPATCLPSRT